MQKNKKLIITFQDIFLFLTRFIKYWKVASLLFLFGLAASLVFYTYGRPTYYSRSLVAFDSVNLPIKSETSDNNDSRGKWAQISNILAAALNSRWLTEQTAKSLGIVESAGQYELIREKFLSSARVTLVPGNILQIEVYAYQPWLVKAWPEAMIATYKDYTLKQRARFRDNAFEEYAKEQARLKDRIISEQNASAKFEEDNKLIEQYIANNGLESVPGEMLTIKNRLDSMDQIVAMLDSESLPNVEKLALVKKFRGTPVAVGTIIRRSRPDDIVSVTTPANGSVVAGLSSDLPTTGMPTMNNGGAGGGPVGAGLAMMMANSQPKIVVPSMVEGLQPWEKTERDLRAARQKREQASNTYLPGHEVIRALDKQINDFEAALTAEVNTAITSFKLEREQMQTRFEELQKKMPDYRRVLNDFDHYKSEFGLMTSGKVLWEAAYADLSKRIATMDYTGIDVRVDFEFQGFTMLRDDIPISPNKQKLLLYGLMLGFGCAAGGCFGLEKLRSTTSLVTETEKITGLNAVGVVPLLQSAERMDLLSSHDNNSVRGDVNLAETFRIVRSSLPLYVPNTNKCQVIMVTSSRPSEGKTMVSSMIARSFADASLKTLLIDGDMRRGRVHGMFDLTQNEGLSGFLAGSATELENYFLPSGFENLDIFCRGRESKPKFEVLSSQLFQKTIEALRLRYDRIVIDTPPILGLADSIMVSKFVDGTVFVIRAEQTTQRDVVTALEVINGTRVPIYGFVLNGVDLSRLENYYYYSSYYPKYYDPSYVMAEG